MKSLSLVLLCFCGCLWAHKFHASLTSIEWNTDSESYEIVMRLFTDDLETALSRKSGNAQSLDADFGLAERQAYEYLKGCFQIKNGAHSMNYEWVGMEVQVDTVWVYLELKAKEKPKDLSLYNSVFFELFKDQVNTINHKDGREKQTLVFSRGDGAKKVTLNGSEQKK